MNISSTAQPQVYYAYINHIILAILGFLSNFYILSAPQCPLGRLIFHSAGFSPCSVTCKTSGCHQNSFKTRRNFDENCCDIWNELLLAPNPSLLWRTLPFNVPQRSLVRFLLLPYQRLIRTGFRRHLALVMATVFQTFGGSATHLNNWWLEPSLVYYQS